MFYLYRGFRSDSKAKIILITKLEILNQEGEGFTAEGKRKESCFIDRDCIPKHLKAVVILYF